METCGIWVYTSLLWLLQTLGPWHRWIKLQSPWWRKLKEERGTNRKKSLEEQQQRGKELKRQHGGNRRQTITKSQRNKHTKSAGEGKRRVMASPNEEEQ